MLRDQGTFRTDNKEDRRTCYTVGLSQYVVETNVYSEIHCALLSMPSLFVPLFMHPQIRQRQHV